MTRRAVLAAVELAMAASASTAATYGLIVASYDPYAAVTWVPIVVIGLGTAAVIGVVAALLFVGRAALLLAGGAVQARRDAEVPPPSATAPLWPAANDAVFDAYVAERAGSRRHGRPVTAAGPRVYGRETAGGAR
jgi:hypothetical protein